MWETILIKALTAIISVILAFGTMYVIILAIAIPAIYFQEWRDRVNFRKRNKRSGS